MSKWTRCSCGHKATMRVVLRYKGSSHETTHHYCTTCTRAFTQHYMRKGHRVRQFVLDAGVRKSLRDIIKKIILIGLIPG